MPITYGDNDTYFIIIYPTGMVANTKANSSDIMKNALYLDAWYGRSGGTVLYIADS